MILSDLIVLEKLVEFCVERLELKIFKRFLEVEFISN